MLSRNLEVIDSQVVAVDDIPYRAVDLDRATGDATVELAGASIVAFTSSDYPRTLRAATAEQIERIRSKPVLLTPSPGTPAFSGYRSDVGELLLVLAPDVQFSAPVHGPFGHFAAQDLAVDWAGRTLRHSEVAGRAMVIRLLSDPSVDDVFDDCGCRVPDCDVFWQATFDERAHLAAAAETLDVDPSVWIRDDATVVMLAFGDVVFPL